MIAPGVSFELIDQSHLDALIKAEVAERRTIEYKQELPGSSDGERQEFLADVTSFANAGGGDLLFGMTADDGVPTKINPLSFEPDSEKLRWEGVMSDGVQPRMIGVRVREILVDGGYVLLIRIPQSWLAPHAVTLKLRRSLRFASRNSAGKTWLDVVELRGAFLRTSALGDRIRNFRDDRIGRIIGNSGPIPLADETKLVTHLVPYQGLSGESPLELNAARGSGLFKPGFGLLLDDERWNIDGLLSVSVNHSGEQPVGDGYAQIFRDGAMELVDADSVRERHHPSYPGIPWISGTLIEDLLISGIGNALATMQRIGVRGTVAVLVSILGAKGRVLLDGSGADDVLGRKYPFDRDTLLLPDLVFDDVDAIADFSIVRRKLRPVADSLWQAGGKMRSPSYNAEGKWIRTA